MRKQLLISVALLGIVSGCTVPGETTGIGAAAGGAVGAGLGAVVGNQTGNAAEGLAIGAAAGAATGSLLGNALQAQNEAILSQDEAIERQEQIIKAQRDQIAELRRLSNDSISYRGEGDQQRLASLDSDVPYYSNRGETAGEKTEYGITAEQYPDPRARYGSVGERNPLPARASSGTPNRGAFDGRSSFQSHEGKRDGRAPRILESNLVHGESLPSDAPRSESESIYSESAHSGFGRSGSESAYGSRGNTDASTDSSETQGSQEVSERRDANTTRNEWAAYSGGEGAAFDSADCQRARVEADEASNAVDNADKLFHFRRALRLCPDHPAYHNGLGEIYMRMGRQGDAEFEFKEALRLNPNFVPALRNLENRNERSAQVEKLY